jgi:hypothetical protein
MAKELHARSLGDIASLGSAAASRGEISTASDMTLLVEMLSGALHTRFVMKDEAVDDVIIARLVDALVGGARGGSARRSVAKRKARKRKR